MLAPTLAATLDLDPDVLVESGSGFESKIPLEYIAIKLLLHVYIKQRVDKARFCIPMDND